MAEFDDIEYEGIGEGRHIVIGSERCFRDYSPGDTIISLSGNGQNLYSCPVPSFEETSHQQPQLQALFEDAIEADTDLPCSLSRDALAAMQKDIPYSGAEPLPLTRYRHDLQAYEQLALGIGPDDYEPDPGPRTPPLCPVNVNGITRQGQPSIGSAVSSLYLSPSPKPSPSFNKLSSAAPESPSSAGQLHELLNVIGTPEWDDNMSPEEQVEHFRRVTRLRRRVRSETKPRALKSSKVRKRDRRHAHDRKDRPSSR
ncbi:hypothetical protein F5Y04DRAFT_175606 [Hypomontagnella monticulosa]|nr:hypothetical protein F5Y04DRAFT_175606 [Hypomontagnella monticulosa]